MMNMLLSMISMTTSLLLLLQTVPVNGNRWYWYCSRYPTDPSCKRPVKAPTKAPTRAPTKTLTKAPSTSPTSAPTSEGSYDIPGITCISDAVNPEPNQLACPAINELVAAAVGHVLNTIVYDSGLLEPTETSVYPDTVTQNDALLPLLGECYAGCEDDTECAPDLFCSEEHEAELQAKGYDAKIANCSATMTLNSVGTVGICFRKELLDTVRRRTLRTSSSATHRKLSCDKKCSTKCEKNPGHPACLFLKCNTCESDDRRLDEDDGNGSIVLDTDMLEIAATAKLRELAGMQNLTSLDSLNCQNFLLTAICSVD